MRLNTRVGALTLSLLLCACGGQPARQPPAADAPPTDATPVQLPTGTATAAPTVAGPTDVPASTTTPAPPRLASAGEVVTLDVVNDGRLDIVVHGVERLDPDAALGVEAPYLLVDWSVRNAGPRAVRWVGSNGIAAILGADGTRLNAEPAFDGVPLRAGDLGTDQQACAVLPGAGPAHLDFLVSSGGWSMPPGAVYRGFTAFRETPGLERQDLLFELSFPTTQVMDGPRTSAVFNLASPPSLGGLDWTGDGASPPDSAEVGDLSFSNVRAGEVTAGGAANMNDYSNSCGFSRTITMTLRNASATTQSLSTGLLLLVDTDGRLYAPRENSFVDIPPQSEAEVSVTFPALEGRDPAALYVGGYLLPGETGALLVTVSR